MRDPYAVLGVDKTASADAIKSAFRKLAKKYHPDANPDNAKAKERFAAASLAYEIIGDEEKRKRFDHGEIDAAGNERATYPGGNPFANHEPGFDDLFRRHQRSGAGAGQGFDAEDVLRTMFGGASPMGGGFGGGNDPFEGRSRGPGGFRAQQGKPAAGKDIKVKLSITIDQILADEKVKLALPDGRTVAVKIPAGVKEGQIIRLSGQGEAGPAGHRGNLLAEVTIRPSGAYRVEQGVLVMDVDVPFKLVAEGGKLPVATPTGKIALKIEPWLSAGRSFRMKGRGLPLGSGNHGDLRVDLAVSLDDLTPAQREAVSEILAK
ncbi:MAG: DnaJ C-terminal domain-containing protein [Pseudomonadota bacterium]